MHSPGTHHTPHQGVVRETHVADRKTLEAEEERERRGRKTLEEELCEWVGKRLRRVVCYQKKKKKRNKKSMLMFYFSSQRTYLTLFWLLAF